MSEVSTAPAGTVVPAAAPVVAPAVVAPVVPAAPVVAPLAAVPAVAAPVAAPVVATPALPVVEDPGWLATRLERAKAAEREAVLKDLGVSDPAAAKAAIAAANAAAEAQKSAEQRALEASNRVTSLSADTERKDKILKEQAGRMLMALTAEQQKAITEFAGADAEKQLQAIYHFAPTWAAQAVAAEAAARAALPAVPAVPAAPANTSPAPGAPSSETPGSPPDPKSVYQTTRATNPFAAAAYGLSNPSVYEQPKT